jgi:hypothetical protein
MYAYASSQLLESKKHMNTVYTINDIGQNTTGQVNSDSATLPDAGDSLLYDAYLVSDHPEIKAAFEVIWADYSKGKSKLKREKDALLNFLCNMAESFIRGRPIAISRRACAYTKGSRYSKLFFKYRRMISLLEYMLENRWIEVANVGLLTFLWVAHSGTVDTGGLPDGRQSRSSCSEGPLNGFAYSGGGPSQTGLTDGEPSMDPQKSQ